MSKEGNMVGEKQCSSTLDAVQCQNHKVKETARYKKAFITCASSKYLTRYRYSHCKKQKGGHIRQWRR